MRRSRLTIIFDIISLGIVTSSYFLLPSYSYVIFIFAGLVNSIFLIAAIICAYFEYTTTQQISTARFFSIQYGILIILFFFMFVSLFFYETLPLPILVGILWILSGIVAIVGGIVYRRNPKVDKKREIKRRQRDWEKTWKKKEKQAKKRERALKRVTLKENKWKLKLNGN